MDTHSIGWWRGCAQVYAAPNPRSASKVPVSPAYSMRYRFTDGQIIPDRGLRMNILVSGFDAEVRFFIGSNDDAFHIMPVNPVSPLTTDQYIIITENAR